MDDGKFTNRELEHYFKDIRTDISEIKTQVIKTNGRVNKLENWKWMLTGGLLIISMMVIPLVIHIFKTAISS